MKNNVISYIKQNKDKSLDDLPINEVDLLVLSLALYVPFYKEKIVDNTPLRDVLYYYYLKNQKLFHIMMMIKDIDLINIIKSIYESIRYKEFYVTDVKYILSDDYICQFAAYTVHFDNKFVCVFSGTDDTFIGWAENCFAITGLHMPAQDEGIKYVQEIINKYNKEDYYICGHSKGGSIALFAGLSINKEDDINRLINIYNFDGPNVYNEDELSSSSYKVREKIINIHPYLSLFGMLLYRDGIDYSIKAYGNKIETHNGFNWVVEHNSFIPKKLSSDSITFSKGFKKILNNYSFETRRGVVNSVMNFIHDEHLTTLTDAMFNMHKMLSFRKHLSKDELHLALELLNLLHKCNFI